MLKRIILKRLILFVPMFIGITLISFALMTLAPGDPTAMLMDPKVSAVDMARIKANLGLDRPVVVQYFVWLKNMLTGNFGYSYINGRPVLELIAERVPATLILMGTSILLIILITIPLGVISAINNRKFVDYLITVLSFVGMSMPVFWVSLMVILLFSLQLEWLPTSGMSDPLNAGAGWFGQLLDLLRHMILPLLVMTIGGLAGMTKYMKNGMLKVLQQDYVTMARASGFSERVVIWRYALKNAILPIITILGMSLPDLLGGAFVIEYIFAWPGMGRLGVDSIFMRDFPVIMGIIVMSSVLIIAGNLLADLAYKLVDPRIRYDKS